MNKFLIVVSTAIIFVCKPIVADEGMWMLPLLKNLNLVEVSDSGFQLTPDDIYSIDTSSLKDAIVIFGGGCTGEVISDQGLILTNHHCGYGAIQYHSSVEHDYLQDGFWAYTKEEEIPTPDLSVTFLISITDVTDTILASISDTLTESERSNIINELSMELEDSVIGDNEYQEATVKSFSDGNYFYLFVYERYNDVRFVGAPPSSIGKYGADTDNWMWPRHTGDFSLFRVYTDKDGNPAKYDEENIPLKPKYHLPISLKGYEKGGFSFVLGYPGGTTRYMTSYELNMVMNIINPNRIKIRGVRQDILLEDMLDDDKVRIQYATKYSRSTNYWKFSIGQNKGLKRLGVIETKKDIEEKFEDWVNTDETRNSKYGDALSIIEENVEAMSPYLNAVQYSSECFRRSCEIINFAYKAKSLYYTLGNGNSDVDEMIESLKEDAVDFYKNYNAATDKKVVKAMLELFKKDINKEFHPDIYDVIETKYKGDYEKYANNMFHKSIFADSNKLNAFLSSPKFKVLKNDMAFRAAVSIFSKNNEVNKAREDYRTKFRKGRRLFMAGLLEMEKDKFLYPDANFTMRFTYGSVQDYYPRDAVYYNYYTTLEGVMEKEDPNNWEFVVPEKLKELYNKKDYGRYAENGDLNVCFISNNDITGGNSGSPVLNGKGELIGLAFDGNWEAMSGDIAFEPDLQRCINVDIRYVLFVIDKYAGATNIINELTIIE